MRAARRTSPPGCTSGWSRTRPGRHVAVHDLRATAPVADDRTPGDRDPRRGHGGGDGCVRAEPARLARPVPLDHRLPTRLVARRQGCEHRDADGRILEHGLHVWPGLLRQRVPGAPRVLRGARPAPHRSGLPDPVVERRVRPRAGDRRVRARRRRARSRGWRGSGPTIASPATPEPATTTSAISPAGCSDSRRTWRGPPGTGRSAVETGIDLALTVSRGDRGRRARSARRWVRPGGRRGLPRLVATSRRASRRPSTAGSCGACTTSSSATATVTRARPRSRPGSACSSPFGCSSTTRARSSGR